MVISSNDEQQTADRACECGAVGFQEKSFLLRELELKLTKAMNERTREQRSRHLLDDLL